MKKETMNFKIKAKDGEHLNAIYNELRSVGLIPHSEFHEPIKADFGANGLVVYVKDYSFSLKPFEEFESKSLEEVTTFINSKKEQIRNAFEKFESYLKNACKIDDQERIDALLFNLRCVSDGEFIYHRELDNGLIFEICIIANSDVFDEMPLLDLKELERIQLLTIQVFKNQNILFSEMVSFNIED